MSRLHKTSGETQKAHSSRSSKTKPRLAKKDVKFGVSYFTGPLRRQDNGELLMCEMCKKAEATWRHEKKIGGSCFLCWGCGNH